MKKLLILLLILMLVFSACSDADKKDADDADNEETDSEDEETEDTEVETKPAEPKELTPEELLADAENQQKMVFQERGEVFIQKREILDAFHDDDIDFDTRQMYQNALDIIKVRESELTLQATLLEKKIQALQDSIEGQEVAAAYTSTIDEMKEERQEYLDRLPEISKEIIAIREKWADEETTPENFAAMQDELENLEDEEEGLIASIEALGNQISDKEEYIEALTDYNYNPDSEEILVKRWAASEGLKVVQNDLVEMYLKLKDASDEEADTIRKYIDDLKDKEGDLANELSNIDAELRGE